VSTEAAKDVDGDLLSLVLKLGWRPAADDKLEHWRHANGAEVPRYVIFDAWKNGGRKMVSHNLRLAVRLHSEAQAKEREVLAPERDTIPFGFKPVGQASRHRVREYRVLDIGPDQRPTAPWQRSLEPGLLADEREHRQAERAARQGEELFKMPPPGERGWYDWLILAMVDPARAIPECKLQAVPIWAVPGLVQDRPVVVESAHDLSELGLGRLMESGRSNRYGICNACGVNASGKVIMSIQSRWQVFGRVTAAYAYIEGGQHGAQR
jgi:hypothetical protein